MNFVDLFHVEHSTIQKLWLIGRLMTSLVCGCKRRDPEPHLSVLIYYDSVKEVRALEAV